MTVQLKPEWVRILVEYVTNEIRQEGEVIDQALSAAFDDLDGDTRALERMSLLLLQRAELMGALGGLPVTAETISSIGPGAVERELEGAQGCSSVTELARRSRILAELQEIVSATASRDAVTA